MNGHLEYGFQRYLTHGFRASGALAAGDSTIELDTVPIDEYWLLTAASASLTVGAAAAGKGVTLVSTLGGVGVTLNPRTDLLAGEFSGFLADGAGLLLVPRSVLNFQIFNAALNDEVSVSWLALKYKRESPGWAGW